ILVSSGPGEGKGESFRRVKATIDKARPDGPELEFIQGDSLGSPQWACVAFGGDREKAKVTVGKTEPHVIVKLNTGPPRIVHYDEGKRLVQQDSVGKNERGLITMFTSLFESNAHSMGSFQNGSAKVDHANVSLLLHFTETGFESAFTGVGAT